MHSECTLIHLFPLIVLHSQLYGGKNVINLKSYFSAHVSLWRVSLAVTESSEAALRRVYCDSLKLTVNRPSLFFFSNRSKQLRELQHSRMTEPESDLTLATVSWVTTSKTTVYTSLTFRLYKESSCTSGYFQGSFFGSLKQALMLSVYCISSSPIMTISFIELFTDTSTKQISSFCL